MKPNFKLFRYRAAAVVLLMLNFSLAYWGLAVYDSAHLISAWVLLPVSLLVGLTPAVWICILLDGSFHDWEVPLAHRRNCNCRIELDF